MKNNLCFIDFETAGIDFLSDSPLELGAVLVDENGSVIKKFHSFIRPQTSKPFTQEAINIHGLLPRDLENSPTPREVLINFFSSMGTDFRFAGWNINFDVSFFKIMCHNSNMMKEFIKINHRHLDIQSINFFMNQLNLLEIKTSSLDDLCRCFSISRRKKHSALEDAMITAEVYFKIKDIFNGKLLLDKQI